jgi:hypothetical protein
MGLVGYGSSTRTDASKKFLASNPAGYGADAWVMPFTAGAMHSESLALGDGEFAADGQMGLNAEGSASGVGSFEGTMQLVVSALAEIAGIASISANVRAALGAAAELAGTGDFDGAINAIGHILSDLSGSGSTDFTPYATGELSASIEIGSAAGLTAPQVAAEILDEQLVETGLTVRETLRLCISALAGKVSGANGSTITFRSASADHKDRIVATVDSSGNRTAVTLDVTD